MKRICEAWRAVTGVIVVSAMGRSGSPYADAQSRWLSGSLPGPPKLDMIMSYGEIITIAVLLSSVAPALRLGPTGMQAGLVTDGCYGNYRLLPAGAHFT